MSGRPPRAGNADADGTVTVVEPARTQGFTPAMNGSASHPPAPGGGADSLLGKLRNVIDHAAHLLPAQGPITVFIHHNTLHAFEHLPFAEAVKRAAKTFGCQPYLGEDRYREELSRGRIRFVSLEAVLSEDLGALAGETIADL